MSRGVPRCTCGDALPPPGEIGLELERALQLLHLAATDSAPMLLAGAMHSVLRASSLLELCVKCTDERIAAAVEAVASAQLKPRRRPYVAPAIEHTRPLESIIGRSSDGES